MAKIFGNTWWGEQWLNALSNIDYQSRIPRGAAYARKDAVVALNIDGNVINAKVQGSRRTPYKQMIVLPKFAKADSDRFIPALLNRPAIISSLLQRRLLPEVMQIAADCGLQVFPCQWSDLKMNCNCPDWAVPCKHLAAVVYMLSREIDNNPFLVFQMHGLDILEVLREMGVQPDSAKSMDVLTLKQSLTRAPKEVAPPAPPVPIDLSGLRDRSDVICQLLAPEPPFYLNGDFRQVYTDEVRKVKKGVGRFLEGKSNCIFLAASFRNFEITPDTEAEMLFTDANDAVVKMDTLGSPLTVSLDEWVNALLALDPDFIFDYSASVRVMREYAMAALHLLACGMMRPQVYRDCSGACVALWRPIINDEAVRGVLDALAAITPGNLIEVSVKGLKKAFRVADPGEWMLSVMASAIVREFASRKISDKVFALLFQGRSVEFDGIGETQVPGSVKAWLDRMDMSHSEWDPIIYVEEINPDSEDSRFEMTISVEGQFNKDEAPIIVPLYHVLGKAGLALKFDVLQNVLRLSTVIPEIEAYIANNGKNPISLDQDRLVKFIADIVPAMRALGVRVYMPKSLQTLLRPKPTLKITAAKGDDESAVISIFDVLRYDWQVAIGSQVVPYDEFMGLVDNASGLVKIKKNYIYVTPEDLQALKKAFADTDKLSGGMLMQAALSEEYGNAPVELTPECRSLLDKLREAQPLNVPDQINATLRPYQQRGFSWMARNMQFGFGSILADDMGLGKTLQAITLMQHLKNEGRIGKERVLVIAPVGLLYNWQAEINRFAPQLTSFIYHGAQRNLKDGADADIVITSYGVARSDGAKLKKGKWCLCVIDEAQNIKNPKTAQAKAVNAIPARARVALSGTPVENRLSEFWSIMQFVNAGYLGSAKNFSQEFGRPIQALNDFKAAKRLKKVTSPFLMRRMKTDKSIIADLPDKIEQNVYAMLSKEQAALYQTTVDEAMAVIENIEGKDAKSLFKRQGLILQMILALKQICNHPAQFLKDGNVDPQLSGKVELLLDRLETIVESGDKVLVFTQFREMGTILSRLIAERLGREPLFYHGGCSVKERSEMVDRFQKGKLDKVFVLSLKAAGTGLNLTAASHVIHFDLWWNPAVEAQATDRAFRIGQKRNVMVERYITHGTFEEKIDRMIQDKKHLADMTVATGENWIGNLSNSELHEIFDR